MQRILLIAGLLAFLIFSAGSSASAQLTADHRKELGALTRQVGQAAALIRKKDYSAAGTQLDEAEKKLKEVATSAGIEETDAAIKKVADLIARQRATLGKASGMSGPAAKPGAEKPDEVSFVKDVAPIINQRCLNCHGENNPRNGLRLDTFAGWQSGGKNGQLLVPGNPAYSLIIARLNAPQGKGQMPPTGPGLSAAEKETIGKWISSGARFDGQNNQMTLTNLIFEDAKKDVKLPKSTGTETVKFTRDIAPWMANLCLNCHNGNRKSGGLSVETYFDIMKGGESGEVVIPGDHENSRFFRLVGGLELPRMPQGQARITRKNYEDMKKWFEEGNTFDGQDPLAPIRSFVPSASEVAQNMFGSKSENEMRDLRKSKTESQFKMVSSAPFSPLTSDEFMIVGDVDKARLEAIQGIAQTQLAEIQKEYGGGQTWRGRLAIFVWGDRANYDQFVTAVESKRPNNEVFGNSLVKLGHEEAYVVLNDQGDNPAKGPNLKELLTEQLTIAYLQRGERPIPLWVSQGAGRVLAEPFAGPARVKSWNEDAMALAPAVSRPDDVFVDGTFSPAASGAIGYSVVKFLIEKRGKNKFNEFLNAMVKGETPTAALKTVYGEEASTIAAAYFASLKAR
ncbi:c-type cytochrome domain-containing protein [Planctomicrobium sp. SH527]|uniref:c-type cytochrome domain-containing protein n=1 Tax=Planctomicrobium sp. SH527 TaxID=3448123 RepID=UPI003F5CA3D2